MNKYLLICVIFFLILSVFQIRINLPLSKEDNNLPNQKVKISSIDQTQDSLFPYKGIINDFTSFIPEQSSGEFFRTSFASFDDYYLRYNWQDVLGGTSDYEISYPNNFTSTWKASWLPDHGIRLSVKTFGDKYSPLDLYYNESYRNEKITAGIQVITDVPWINKVSEIILGDEAPATLYKWNNIPYSYSANDLLYNETFFNETGFYFRYDYSSNKTQQWIFDNWLSNRTMTAMNDVYYAFKQVFPNKSVGWNTIPWPGYEPTLLKGDFIYGGYYTDNIKKYYSEIRNAKLSGLNVPVWSIINGDDVPTPDNPFFQSMADQERFFWTAYFAGGDKVAWFNAGNNQIWTDFGDQHTFDLYQFHSELDKLANNLPVVSPNPLVLEIDSVRGADVGPCFGFREYDSTTQIRASKADFDLNKYDLIIIENQNGLMDTLSEKLSNYVNSGGNIILKGASQPIGLTTNISGLNRLSLLPLENGTNLKIITRYDSQVLSLQDSIFKTAVPLMNVDYRSSINFTNSANWNTITTGLPEESLGYYPLALFHNTSLVGSGNIFYYGFDSNVDNNLYFPLVRNFVEKQLNINDILSPVDHPDWLITSGLDNGNRTVVGIIPDSQGGDYSLILNSASRGYPSENVWIYEGLNDSLWYGEVGTPINTIYTTVFPNTPQRWLITPQSPSNEMYLQLKIQYPFVNPHYGENLPIKLLLYQPIQHLQLQNTKIRLTLPNNMTNVTKLENNIVNAHLQPNLDSLTEYSEYWLINATGPGLYPINVTITATNIPMQLNYTFLYPVYPGRVEVSPPDHIYVTEGEPFYLNGSFTYYGVNSQSLEVWALIQGLIWGNPGGMFYTVTLNPGETNFFSIPSAAVDYKTGETGIYRIYILNSNQTVWGEEYVEVTVIPAKIEISNLIYNEPTQKLSLYLQTIGIAYCENVIATLSSTIISI
ncbi:MAG: hypothetical protein ACFFD1_14270, partial [Candidatus Thorarchaeota archaeon]